MARTKRFAMCISPEESAMLKELAADLGVDQADVLRVEIRQKHEARFGRRPEVTQAGR